MYDLLGVDCDLQIQMGIIVFDVKVEIVYEFLVVILLWVVYVNECQFFVVNLVVKDVDELDEFELGMFMLLCILFDLYDLVLIWIDDFDGCILLGELIEEMSFGSLYIIVIEVKDFVIEEMFLNFIKVYVYFDFGFFLMIDEYNDGVGEVSIDNMYMVNVIVSDFDLNDMLYVEILLLLGYLIFNLVDVMFFFNLLNG